MEIKLYFIIARMRYIFVLQFDDKMGTDDSRKQNSLLFLFLRAAKRLFNACQIRKFFSSFSLYYICVLTLFGTEARQSILFIMQNPY